MRHIRKLFVHLQPIMINLTRNIYRTLSLRISLMVVCAIAVLLAATLFVMFRFSRKAMKEEALQKASQTLEATVQQIDNVLLSVEQASGNIYFDLMQHLDEPEKMFTYSRRLVEDNPYITGCAIAMKPYYYEDSGQYFMAYVYQKKSAGLQVSTDSIIQAETFGDVPYPEQIWFAKPMETGLPCWIEPLKDQEADGGAIMTFSLPFYQDGQPVGVLAVDVSIALLTRIVMSAKPTPNAYATLLGNDGPYIVHPDSSKRMNETVFTQTKRGADPSLLKAAQAMMSGETGYKPFTINGTDCFVFYKPFVRTAVPGRYTENLGWSAGIVFPEDDIFGDYNNLLTLVLAVAIVGLLLLLILCGTIIHSQLLPLRLLTKQAQHIAEGNYEETIPDSQQDDEVGRLQHHFKEMQKALSANMGELKRLTDTLNERGKVLEEAYEQAKEGDRMKTAFLHNMTNQMTAPVNNICNDVLLLCNQSEETEAEKTASTVSDILQKGKVVTVLLNDLLDVSQNKE